MSEQTSTAEFPRALCRNVSVNAPTRLHFGLLAFGNQEGRNFGGVGLMLKKPRIKVKVKASDSFQTTAVS